MNVGSIHLQGSNHSHKVKKTGFPPSEKATDLKAKEVAQEKLGENDPHRHEAHAKAIRQQPPEHAIKVDGAAKTQLPKAKAAKEHSDILIESDWSRSHHIPHHRALHKPAEHLELFNQIQKDNPVMSDKEILQEVLKRLITPETRGVTEFKRNFIDGKGFDISYIERFTGVALKDTDEMASALLRAAIYNRASKKGTSKDMMKEVGAFLKEIESGKVTGESGNSITKKLVEEIYEERKEEFFNKLRDVESTPDEEVKVEDKELKKQLVIVGSVLGLSGKPLVNKLKEMFNDNLKLLNSKIVLQKAYKGVTRDDHRELAEEIEKKLKEEEKARNPNLFNEINQKEDINLPNEENANPVFTKPKDLINLIKIQAISSLNPQNLFIYAISNVAFEKKMSKSDKVDFIQNLRRVANTAPKELHSEDDKTLKGLLQRAQKTLHDNKDREGLYNNNEFTVIMLIKELETSRIQNNKDGPYTIDELLTVVKKFELKEQKADFIQNLIRIANMSVYKRHSDVDINLKGLLDRAKAAMPDNEFTVDKLVKELEAARVESNKDGAYTIDELKELVQKLETRSPPGTQSTE